MHTTTATYTMAGNPQQHVSQLLRSQIKFESEEKYIFYVVCTIRSMSNDWSRSVSNNPCMLSGFGGK